MDWWLICLIRSVLALILIRSVHPLLIWGYTDKTGLTWGRCWHLKWQQWARIKLNHLQDGPSLTSEGVEPFFLYSWIIMTLVMLFFRHRFLFQRKVIVFRKGARWVIAEIKFEYVLRSIVLVFEAMVGLRRQKQTLFLLVSPGSGSWRSGQHRQGPNSEEDGLKEERRSDQLSPHRWQIQEGCICSVLYCNLTDSIGTRRSNCFLTRCKTLPRFRLDWKRKRNLGHVRLKNGFSSFFLCIVTAYLIVFLTGCYR